MSWSVVEFVLRLLPLTAGRTGKVPPTGNHPQESENCSRKDKVGKGG